MAQDLGSFQLSFHSVLLNRWFFVNFKNYFKCTDRKRLSLLISFSTDGSECSVLTVLTTFLFVFKKHKYKLPPRPFLTTVTELIKIIAAGSQNTIRRGTSSWE